jgi:feruloyl esterase
MPVAGWNGRLDAVGGQGWAGTIGYAAMRAALRKGYAVAATDSGHTTPGGRFAMETEPLVDFAHRSTHEMAVKGKAIVQAFYGTGPRASFFDGCSTGGRMALTAAQRYPADFDGIIAGAPANYSSHQAAQMMSVALAVHRSEASYLPPDKLALLHRAVVQACDARDGVGDGVLENPLACAFDPEVLACKGAEGPDCLSVPQVAAARAIYAPIVHPQTKAVIFPGLAPGGENGWGLVAGPRPLEFPIEIYRYAVFRNPDWDHRTLDLAADVGVAEKANGGILDAVDPELGPFFRRGGKLLQYHGWSDPAVAPQNSIDYYQRVSTRLGGPAAVHDSYRLFMVPGMGHCGGGDGTSTFDALAALERWVESGRPPDVIPASRVVSGTVTRTRPLCAYPQVASYTGSGSTDDAASFICKAP